MLKMCSTGYKVIKQRENTEAQHRSMREMQRLDFTADFDEEQI
jgi:hypothetical protein